MIQSAVGLVHVVTAVLALLAGLAIFLRKKAGPLHRFLGYVYSLSMLVMLVTALSIYQLTGSFNLLHGFALISTATFGRGLYHAVSRKPKGAWLDAHYQWIIGSYIGLCGALVAESSTRFIMPLLRDHYGLHSFGWFWVVVGVATFVVVWVGQVLMNRYRGILKNHRR
jgi:uncharacterized membrane protein